MLREDKVITYTSWNLFCTGFGVVSGKYHTLKFELRKKIKNALQVFVHRHFLKTLDCITGNNR